MKNNNSIQEVKEIPLYEYGKGCSIGNQTSQAFGLIYLYDFNHYMKEKLKLKYAINYMDDFIIIHEDKEYLEYCLKEIRKYLFYNLKLDLNEKKTRIDSIKNGIDFLGYKFIIKNNKLIMKLRTKTKKNFKKKVKNLNLLCINDYINNNEFTNLLSSYKGLLGYGSCNNLYYKYTGMNLK